MQSEKTSKRHATWLTYGGSIKEKNSGESMTQPDMAMSLEQLLRRHARGQEIPTFEPQYDDENGFMPNPKTLDLSEIHDMAQSNAERIKEMRESLVKAKSGAQPAGRKSAEAEESAAEEAHPSGGNEASPPTANG